jgi:nicotinate-nucleotide adenylyltransferase
MTTWSKSAQLNSVPSLLFSTASKHSYVHKDKDMKIGLFFGTFNPIHVGHLIIANHMVQQSTLDQVWLVVSPHNPLKKKSGLLKDTQRLAMVRLSVEDNPRLWASNVEFELEQPSYTIRTLLYLIEKYPGYEFSIIMGEDNLRTFHKWYNYEKILENHVIHVYPRIGNTVEEDNLEMSSMIAHPHIVFCRDTPVMNISATLIRKAIQEGKDVRYLLTESVHKYVEEMHFYK